MPAKREPQVRYEDDTWHVTLPLDDGRAIDASWCPPHTYVVRIREAGTDNPWSFGVRTPLASVTFVDLEPDTEYELQVRTRTAAGEGPPALFRFRTDPKGHGHNVVPFPRR